MKLITCSSVSFSPSTLATRAAIIAAHRKAGCTMHGSETSSSAQKCQRAEMHKLAFAKKTRAGKAYAGPLHQTQNNLLIRSEMRNLSSARYVQQRALHLLREG